jgi:glycosyltransferase involved in cell wall biosynthesis
MLTGSIYRWIFYLIANILRVPLAIELCERPWSLRKKSSIDFFLHPLKSVDGVIVISSFLRQWALKEKRRSKHLRILDLPILVDVEECESKQNQPGEGTCNIIFAGSSSYDTTIEFILESMVFVWEKYPNAKLILTGCREDDPRTEALQNELKNRNVCEKVVLAGYLPRPDLLSLYQSASALLIPLFDDIRSRARFPTKIGEYLCSGKPVVTNKVGEIPRYFTDGENAFICDPGNPRLYAHKIIDAVNPDNHKLAEMVGQNGKLLAKKTFDFRNHDQAIMEFFSVICNQLV